MGDRGFIEWEPQDDSGELIEHISTLINGYKNAGYPSPTCRDVYYDLLGQYGAEYGYVKGKPFQRRVYRFLTKMRRSGMIGFSDINDDSFDSLVLRSFADHAHFWTDIQRRARTYRKDLTVNQSKRIKIFTEGAGMVRQFHTVAEDYTIPVYSPGGWDSISLKHDTAVGAVNEYERHSRQTVILHTGDLDPDGMALFDVFVEDVQAFIHDFGHDAEDVIRFRRIMITVDQAGLLPEGSHTHFSKDELKKKNYRGHKWPLDFKTELQALPMPERLRAMRGAIEEEVDLDQLEIDRETNADEHEELQERISELIEAARGE